MSVNLAKSVFTSAEADFIITKLEEAAEKGFIKRRTENNIYLQASYAGVEEMGITPKWNIKIYTHSIKKRGHSLVCVDKHILERLVAQDYESFTPPDLPLLRIDDAGWGFPLCGVMVGVSDEVAVKTAVVPVEYFQNDTRDSFKTKKYLKQYARLARELVKQFGASPETHRIEICTGYVNQTLRESLRQMGYDVRVVEIKGLLQDQLEEAYRAYIEDEVQKDIYYDPKAIKEAEIPRRYRACLTYGQRYFPEKVKTGWKAIGG